MEAMNLFDKYGSAPPPPSPFGTYDEVDTHTDAEDDRSDVGEADEAGAGRPFRPRYATYGWGSDFA